MLGLLVWLVYIITDLFYLVLLARVVISWLIATRTIRLEYEFHPVVRWVERVTEPILFPIRRQLSKYDTGPFDFSPIIAMFGIFILQKILIAILRAAGAH